MAVIQFNKTPSTPELQKTPSTDTPLNTKDLVFYELKSPTPAPELSSTTQPAAVKCTTDLECETGHKPIIFKFSDEQANNTNKHINKIPQENPDNIEILISNDNNSAQKSKDEMYDLIDNLGNLQQAIDEGRN